MITRHYIIQIVPHKFKRNGMSIILTKSKYYETGFKYDFQLGVIRRVHTIDKAVDAVQALLKFHEIEVLNDFEDTYDKIESCMIEHKTGSIVFGEVADTLEEEN